MRVAPVSRNEALAWLSTHHRHLRRSIAGWLFGIQILSDEDERIGVACAGRPARLLQDGLTIEITRVCILDDQYNACSFAYAALRRAAVALGYRRVITYTRLDELSTSCKAAGFRDDGPAGGGEASRPSRPRKPSEDPSPKRRWVWEVRS